MTRNQQCFLMKLWILFPLASSLSLLCHLLFNLTFWVYNLPTIFASVFVSQVNYTKKIILGSSLISLVVIRQSYAN